jgi:hypothetical protein
LIDYRVIAFPDDWCHLAATFYVQLSSTQGVPRFLSRELRAKKLFPDTFLGVANFWTTQHETSEPIQNDHRRDQEPGGRSGTDEAAVTNSKTRFNRQSSIVALNLIFLSRGQP